jgi:TolA-binding protein
MSKKTRKYFFGIFEDGPILKIVQLIAAGGNPILIDLKKTEMECSIYHDIDKRYENEAPEMLGTDLAVDNLPDIDLSAESELDSVVSPHEHLLSVFPLNQGKLGLNANDEKLSVNYLDRPVRNLTKRDLIKLQLLSQEEAKDKDVIWGLLQTAQDQTCIMVHKGENRLFSYLQKYNQIQSERKYFYSLIDSNDISLINAVRLNYEINKEDDILIIYLGFEYKKGILMKGEELVKSLPILTSSESYDLEREICSRLALYQDEMEIPHVEKVILAGEYCQDNMLEAISKTFPNAEVERFKFNKLLYSETMEQYPPEEELAAYVIPISLAWKVMEGKSSAIIQTNFLEKKIIKSQKLVQFSWHSFIMLAILLGISYSYTGNILNVQHNLRQLEKRYEDKKLEYEKIQKERDPGPDIQSEINKLTARLEKMKMLYNHKAIWSKIFEELAEKVNSYGVTWLKNIQGNKDGFTVFGTTTKRENIVKLSSAFPNGTIKAVQSAQWDDQLVWSFEIRYNYLPALPIVQNWSETRQQKKISANREEIRDNQAVVSLQKVATKIDPVFEHYRKITESYYEFKHDDLITIAKEFIDKYPQNTLATNSRYLLAEVYYNRDRIAESEELLDAVLMVESPMEPYALFKQAQIYAKTSRRYLAMVNLNLLIRKFTSSDVVPKAKDLLAELESAHE